MSAIFRKSPKGEIEASVINDGAPILINRSFRIVEGFRVDIAHWLEPQNATSWYALRNPCLPLLDNRECPEFFGWLEYDGDEDRAADSLPVFYQGVVLMGVTGIFNEPSAYLTDLSGNVLAGSNVYAISGHLCLGNSLRPFTLQPVEMLLHNEANTDLNWWGEPLEGAWQNEVFHINKWPTTHKHISPPAAILADIARWWPT